MCKLMNKGAKGGGGRNGERRGGEGGTHPTVVRTLLFSSCHDLLQALIICFCNHEVRVQVYC